MTTLGKYELHEQLGRGGFGTVYRAIDTTLNREVALKVLHPQLTTDPDFLERFRNEARLVASLRSPHIVTIHELGEADGRYFIAMEYLAGGSLKQRLESGPIPYPQTVEIMRQVCDGLSVAHAKGLVHRDIKPGNILFDTDGRAVIADFGLARAVQVSSSSASSSTGGVGTPAYRAPELWRGKPPASPATDIYSLGCVLSEMLTSKALFDGSTPEEIITQHLVDGPDIPASYPAGVPEKMQGFIAQALTKDLQKRTANTSAFMQGLEGLTPQTAVHAVDITEESTFTPVRRVEVAKVSEPVQPTPSTEPQQSETPRKGLSKTLLFILAGVALVTLVIGVSTNWFGHSTLRPALTVEVTDNPTPKIEPSPVENNIANHKIKVFGAFATPIEEPWSNIIHTALQKAEEDGKIDYTYTENIGYSGNMERVLRDECGNNNPDLVVGDSYLNEEVVRNVAKDFPEIAFAFGSELGPEAPNFSVFDNWNYEPAYLCGMIAGGMTKSNVIGVVGAVPIPEVNRLINAYIAGAKNQNPDVKVLVTFINSWLDPAAAKDATNKMIDNGADLIFGEVAGVIESAAEKGVYTFGNLHDQHNIAPNYVISSAVWNMSPTIEFLIMQVKNESFTSMNLSEYSEMPKGGSSLAPFYELKSEIPSDVLAEVLAMEKRLIEGQFNVPILETQPEAIN